MVTELTMRGVLLIAIFQMKSCYILLYHTILPLPMTRFPDSKGDKVGILFVDW